MIQRIILYDLRIVDIDGEYKEVRENEEVFPCLLTNYSLYIGKRDGLVKTSLTQEFFNITAVYNDGINVNEMTKDEKAAYGIIKLKDLNETVDEDKVLKIIYLGLIGADPTFKYDFETFTRKYHAMLEEKLQVYMELVSDLVISDNKFKAEFERLTSNEREKGSKK